MKITQRIFAILLALAITLSGRVSLSLAASTPKATKALTITVGKKKSIQVKGPNILSKAFKSSNTKIATVNKKGIVTAKKAGNCKITVTIKYRKTKKAKKSVKKVLTTKVTVKKVPAPDSSTSGKNAKDVAALKGIIQSQNNAGANLDDNLDSWQYIWSPDGRLTHIDWGYCNLTGRLSLASLPKLTDLACYGNELTSLDLSKNTALTGLYCYSNRLSSLNLSNNPSLQEVYCYNNKITSLDLSGNRLLKEIICDQNVSLSGAPDSCKISYYDPEPTETPTKTPDMKPTQAPITPPTNLPVPTPVNTPTLKPIIPPTAAPTAAPSVKPPFSPATGGNFDSLKSYITKSGKTNSNGNKYILYTDSDGIEYRITYDSTNKAFDFSILYQAALADGTEAIDVLVMTVKEIDLKNGDLECVVIYSSGSYANLTATAELDTLTSDSSFRWKLVESDGGSYETWRDLADVTYQLAYSGWNKLLTQTMGITMEELTSDTSPVSPTVTNFNSLKSYILSNGTKTNAGDVLVSYVDSNNIIYGIGYNASSRNFYFVMVYETTSGEDSVEDDMLLTIKEDDLEKGILDCSVTFSSGAYADLSTEAYIDSINRSSQFNWTLNHSNSGSYDYWRDLADLTFQLAYQGWNEALGNLTNLSLTDLGFH